MNFELIFTSVPNGLNVGSRGPCTVACTDGIPTPVVSLLEKLSAYRQSSSRGQTPVTFSHLHANFRGRKISVCSRITPAGQDFDQRPNKVAHHRALLQPGKIVGGPSALLSRADLFVNRWSGEPRRLGPVEIKGQAAGPQQCFTWLDVTGDAAWVSPLLESYLAGQVAYVIVSPEIPALDLIDEALRLLPETERWRVTFSTNYIHQIPGVECQWRFVLAGSPEASDAKRNPNALVLDLTRNLGAARGGLFADNARQGVLIDLSEAKATVKPSRKKRFRDPNQPDQSKRRRKTHRTAGGSQTARRRTERPSHPQPASVQRPLEPIAPENPSTRKSSGFGTWLKIVAAFLFLLVLGLGALLALMPSILDRPFFDPLLAKLDPIRAMVRGDDVDEEPIIDEVNPIDDPQDSPVAPGDLIAGDIPRNVNADESKPPIDPPEQNNGQDVAGLSRADQGADQGRGNGQDAPIDEQEIQIGDQPPAGRGGDRLQIGGLGGTFGFEREDGIGPRGDRGANLNDNRGQPARPNNRPPVEIAGGDKGGDNQGLAPDEDPNPNARRPVDRRQHPVVAGLSPEAEPGMRPARKRANRNPDGVQPAGEGGGAPPALPPDDPGRRNVNEPAGNRPAGNGPAGNRPAGNGPARNGAANAGSPDIPPNPNGGVRPISNRQLEKLPPIESCASVTDRLLPVCRFRREVQPKELLLSILNVKNARVYPAPGIRSRWNISKRSKVVAFFELQSAAGISELKIGVLDDQPVPETILESLDGGVLQIEGVTGPLKISIPFNKPPVSSGTPLSFKTPAKVDLNVDYARAGSLKVVRSFVEQQLSARSSESALLDFSLRSSSQRTIEIDIVWEQIEGTTSEKKQLDDWLDYFSLVFSTSRGVVEGNLTLNGYQEKSDAFDVQVAKFLRSHIARRVRDEVDKESRKLKKGERVDTPAIRQEVIAEIQQRYKQMEKQHAIPVPVVNPNGDFTTRPSIQTTENLVQELCDRLTLEIQEIARMDKATDGSKAHNELMTQKRERVALRSVLKKNKEAIQGQLNDALRGLTIPVGAPVSVGGGNYVRNYALFHFGELDFGFAESKFHTFLKNRW